MSLPAKSYYVSYLYRLVVLELGTIARGIVNYRSSSNVGPLKELYWEAQWWDGEFRVHYMYGGSNEDTLWDVNRRIKFMAKVEGILNEYARATQYSPDAR